MTGFMKSRWLWVIIAGVAISAVAAQSVYAQLVIRPGSKITSTVDPFNPMLSAAAAETVSNPSPALTSPESRVTRRPPTRDPIRPPTRSPFIP